MTNRETFLWTMAIVLVVILGIAAYGYWSGGWTVLE
jgi:hypothetical protein